ncbi:MAG: hypothetical protein ACR2JE_16940 [Acidobacteriaceae bacterium]
MSIDHIAIHSSASDPLRAGGFPGEAPDVFPGPGPNPSPDPEPDLPDFPDPDPDPDPLDPTVPEPITVN